MSTVGDRLWQRRSGSIITWRCVLFGYLQEAREEYDEQHRSKVYLCSRRGCSWRKYP